MTAVPSSSTVPIWRGCMVFATRAPTVTSERPREAALARSTVTATYGREAARFDVTCPMPSLPSSAVMTASVAVCSVSAEGAVTSISTLLEANPPCPAETVMSPTPSRAPVASSTSWRTFSWSAEVSVVME